MVIAAEGWSVSHFKDSALGCNAVSWAPFNSVGSQGPAGPIRRVVTASCDKTIKIWSLAEGETEWTKQELSSVPAHSDWVRDVAWAPSTGLPVNLIASCSEDKHVYIWSQTAEDTTWKRELLHVRRPVWRVSWSVTGNVLAVSSGDHKVTLWKETLDKKWMYVFLPLYRFAVAFADTNLAFVCCLQSNFVRGRGWCHPQWQRVDASCAVRRLKPRCKRR